MITPAQELVHTKGRIVAKVEVNQKNAVTLSNGTELILMRNTNNLDKAYTGQTLCTVVSGESIPKGALMLIHFNAVHDSNKIFNYTGLSGEEIANGVGYYSFEESQCFLWKMPGDEEWNPIGPFVLGLRLFIPYQGLITGIDPTQMKNVLYITSGELKGNVVHTVNAADYRLIFRSPETGKEEVLIRCRHFPDSEKENDREEILCINHDLTEQVNKRELLIGITPNDAKVVFDKKICPICNDTGRIRNEKGKSIYCKCEKGDTEKFRDRWND